MEVTIFGPSLPREMQEKGYLHVHASGCRDCGKYRGENARTENVESAEELVLGNFGEMMRESGCNDWTVWESEFYWAPCTMSLPNRA